MDPSRSRMRFDIRDDLVRAAKARAAFDGVDLNKVVANALEAYLPDELATLKKKQASASPPAQKAGKSK